MALMLLGNAGFITAVSSLIVSFVSADSSEGLLGAVWFRTTVMVFGLAALWFLAHTDWVDRWLSKWITSVLHRWTDLEVRDYASLLHLSGDYAVAEKVVTDDNWLADRPLKSLRLNDEGVLVLGIEKADGSYLGAPRGKYVLSTGDTVIFYGPRSVLADLDVRRAGREGNWEHHLAVERHLQHAAAEEQMLEGQHPDDDSEHSSETDSDQGRTRAARTRTELPPSEKRERSTDRTDRRAAKAW